VCVGQREGCLPQPASLQRGRDPWDNASYPPDDALREAAEAAQATMDKLSNPCFCKIMLPSMVAGGCWMEAPQVGLCTLNQVDP
jgi:hypothetical protein